jgi:hypothetical protein
MDPQTLKGVVMHQRGFGVGDGVAEDREEVFHEHSKYF